MGLGRSSLSINAEEASAQLRMDDPVAEPYTPLKPPPPAVPGRMKQLVSAVVFDFASVLLLLQFLALHCAESSWYSKTTGCTWVSGPLIDWCGALSCIGWFVGFTLLIDWIVWDTFPVWGFSRRALAGATLKLIASAFFCVEPLSDMSGYLNAVPRPHNTSDPTAPPDYPPAAGVPWSNFVGIVFFHTGNCVDAVGMAPLFNRARPCSGANLPVFGIWGYMTATWFLVIAGGIAYWETPYPWHGPHAVYASSARDFVAPGQIIGAFLLLLASLCFTLWAACVGRPRAVTEPLLMLGVGQQ